MQATLQAHQSTRTNLTLCLQLMAALLSAPLWDTALASRLGAPLRWLDAMLASIAPQRTSLGPSQPRAAHARRALRAMLLHNGQMAPLCLDRCYAHDANLADAYFGVFAEVAPALVAAQGIDALGPRASVIALILCKLVESEEATRTAALDLLQVLMQQSRSGSPPGKVRRPCGSAQSA